MQSLTAKLHALKTSEMLNHLGSGFGLLSNTHKWFTVCRCDGNLKAAWLNLPAIRIFIHSEDGGADRAERRVICKHGGAQWSFGG